MATRIKRVKTASRALEFVSIRRAIWHFDSKKVKRDQSRESKLHIRESKLNFCKFSKLTRILNFRILSIFLIDRGAGRKYKNSFFAFSNRQNRNSRSRARNRPVTRKRSSSKNGNSSVSKMPKFKLFLFLKTWGRFYKTAKSCFSKINSPSARIPKSTRL